VAGEHSGHFYFKDNFYAESSLLAGLLMIEIVSKTGKKAYALRKQFDVYPQSGEINFVVPDRDAMVNEIKNEFGSQASSIDELEGYSFYFDAYWFNVRLSKTEPLLRLNVEADSQEILDEKTNELIAFIEEKGGKRKN
jgi:phosphomannomutase